MWMMMGCNMINIVWIMKKTDYKVSILYPSPRFGGVRWGLECDTLTRVIARFHTNIPGVVNCPLKNRWDAVKSVCPDYVSNLVNPHQKHVRCCICKVISFNENWLKAYYQQYLPISMNELRLPDTDSPPSECDWPEQSLFDFSWCTWMAIHALLN